MNPAGDMIGAVPEKTETRRASRYDAVIATLVGLCALCVSADSRYTRQQRGRTGDYPACHSKGGWPAGEELEGGTRENIGTWGATGFRERHEWSCVRRG